MKRASLGRGHDKPISLSRARGNSANRMLRNRHSDAGELELGEPRSVHPRFFFFSSGFGASKRVGLVGWLPALRLPPPFSNFHPTKSFVAPRKKKKKMLWPDKIFGSTE